MKNKSNFILIFILPILVTTNAIALSQKDNMQEIQQFWPTNFDGWLGLSNKLFQIFFFIIIGTITWLTYLKAKKTLLQPIRTEVFKEQIKEFSNILKLFIGKGEIELREDFAFDKLFHANSCMLIDDYASLFFEIKIDRDKRPYNRNDCPSALCAEGRLEKCDEYIRLESDEEKKQVRPDPRTKAAIWTKYKFDMISLPKEFNEAKEKLHKIIESPLLPKQCIFLLQDFIKTIMENIHILEKILTECAQEILEKYPTIELLKKSSNTWIYNKYNEKFIPLKEKADKITEYLRNYFGTEELLK